MRLRIFALSIMVAVLFNVATFTTFAASSDDDKIGKDDKCLCAAAPVKKRTSKGRTVKGRKAKKPVTKPKPVRPTPPPVTVNSADFDNISVVAGQEGYAEGTLTLSSGKDIDDYSAYLNVEPSSNVQAWISGKTLTVFSPNGGNARVLVKDKRGKLLDIVQVTSELVAAPTDQRLLDAANATVANTATSAYHDWWQTALLVAILIAIVLFGLIRTFQLSRLRTALANMFNDLQTAVTGFRNDVTERIMNIDQNVADACEHYGLTPRRAAMAGPDIQDDIR